MLKKIFQNHNILLALNICCIFLAIFFENLSVSTSFSAFGRMHPMFLHFPIGFFFVVILFQFFKKEFPIELFNKVNNFLLGITAWSAAITCLMGLMLASEGGYGPNLLNFHKWFGISFSIISYFLYSYQHLSIKREMIIGVLGVFLIVLTGHYGAELTHGHNFILEKYQEEKEKPLNENENMYVSQIKPILDSKCVSCHNKEKMKGELDLDDIAGIIKGGEHGPVIVSGNSQKSNLIQSIMLPIEDKKHMPPKNKNQLTNDEFEILKNWIDEGADTKKTIAQYPDNSKLKNLIVNNYLKYKEVSYEFKPLSEKKIKELNTPFCTVKPIAYNSPALVAEFFVSQKFDPNQLKKLNDAKVQLVELNLGKMPVENDELKNVGKFENLEKLNLNFTKITGEGLNYLKDLNNLQELSLNVTKIDKENLIKLLQSLKNLKNLYLWENGISASDVELIQKKYPNIKVSSGFKPDKNDVVKLSPPLIENKNFVLTKPTSVILKHPLGNVQIRYTLNGTLPDSISSLIYEKPLAVNKSTTINSIATKDGWLTSEPSTFSFFMSKFEPDTVLLATAPNPKYKGQGATNFCNLKTADLENFQDPEWLGFNNGDVVTYFYFDDNQPVNEVTLSYLRNVGSYIFPPKEIKLYGGDSKNSLSLLSSEKPLMPSAGDLNKKIGITLSTNNKHYKIYKLVTTPLPKLPSWHQGSGTPAWLFVDEVFFN